MLTVQAGMELTPARPPAATFAAAAPGTLGIAGCMCCCIPGGWQALYARVKAGASQPVLTVRRALYAHCGATVTVTAGGAVPAAVARMAVSVCGSV
jgi:hypothetical protein